MKKISHILLIALFTIGATSCRKSFLDVNNNPNQNTSASYQLVLPAALNSTAYYVTTGNEFANYWMGTWAISNSYVPISTEITFTFSNAYHQDRWSGFYYSINNFNYIDQAATASSDYFYAGIAKAMKVYCYQNLVDIYGNIPYSQALQISSYPRPKYDADTAIYASLFKQLDSARTLINNWNADLTPAPTETSDIMFSGSNSLWLKFINTLELRMLLRFTNIAKPAYYDAELSIVNNDANGFLGVGESALSNPGYSSSADAKLNPFYAAYGYNAAGNVTDNYGYYRANAYAIDFYNSNNDPRIGFFYAANALGNFAGNDFGVQGTAANKDISGIGISSSTQIGIIDKPSQSSPILTSFESLFLQSEAVQRGLISGDLKELYKSALQESFAYCGLTKTDATTYYSQSSDLVNIDSTADPLKTILTQKWASINAINPLEVYADYRRTKIPADLPGSKAKSAGAIPLRLLYPQTEISTNPDNVKAQGGINIYSKIFWVK